MSQANKCSEKLAEQIATLNDSGAYVGADSSSAKCNEAFAFALAQI